MKKKFVMGIILTLILIVAGYILYQNSHNSDFSDFFLGMATGISSVTFLVWITVILVLAYNKSKKSPGENQTKSQNHLIFSVGMICLLTGIVLAMHNRENALILYLCVLIFIISMVFNIIYIQRIRTCQYE